MAGSSRPAELPDDWISDADFRAELSRLEADISARQLERWRGEGLLPAVLQVPAYSATGRVDGSTTWHPPSSPRQALAIARALASKNLTAFAGEALWAAGFAVDERYWRPLIVGADTFIRRLNRAVRLLARDRDSDTETFGDRVEANVQFNGLMHKVARRLDTGELATLTSLLTDIFAAKFRGFEFEPTADGEASRSEIFVRGMALEGGENDQVHGEKLKFTPALSAVFSNISASINGIPLNEFSDQEINCARSDVVNALKIGACLYEATAWIYGPQSFGLRIAAQIGKSQTAATIAAMTLAFARMRRNSNSFLASDEISQLAHRAEMIWLISGYFREVQLSDPKTRQIVSPARLKLAFTDSHKYRELLKELEGREFPAPEFRPWDQWKKLSRKTMSPGLLAMSIGAPSKLSLAAVLQGASDAAIP